MLHSILRILALTRKELLAILKDPRTRMSLLVPSLVQTLIFGYAATSTLRTAVGPFESATGIGGSAGCGTSIAGEPFAIIFTLRDSCTVFERGSTAGLYTRTTNKSPSCGSSRSPFVTKWLPFRVKACSAVLFGTG